LTRTSSGPAAAFVLVPGACHGGWWYDDVATALSSRGHDVDALTLLGLEDEPDPDRRINLDSHIEQVSAATLRASAGPAGRRPVVLVAHSYGGMPCTAVADRHPDVVSALVLVDALLPEDGDSGWAITNQRQRDWFIAAGARTGDAVDPLPSFDPRTRPHPLGSLLQQVRLTGAWREVPVRHYVSVPWPGVSPLAVSTARAREDASFVVHAWNTRHDVLHDGPGRVVGLLERVAAEVG
jgi:pimeloyl-ACP methyl ester carboxylesterase